MYLSDIAVLVLAALTDALASGHTTPPAPVPLPSISAPRLSNSTATSAATPPFAIPSTTALSPPTPALELRQMAPPAVQYPTVTTQWIETSLPDGAGATWVPVVYTQTFAAVPDQLPGPGSGSVGLATTTAARDERGAAVSGRKAGALLAGIVLAGAGWWVL